MGRTLIIVSLVATVCSLLCFVQLYVLNFFEHVPDNALFDIPIVGSFRLHTNHSSSYQNQATGIVVKSDANSTVYSRSNVQVNQSQSDGEGEDGEEDYDYFYSNVDDENYFSACLLIRDDNHLLPEWLAYHYTFLPLRRLIVSVDPNSRTSPRRVLNRFRPYMNITVWSDEDFHFQELPTETSVERHKERQKFFINKCLLWLKMEGAPKWVAFVDTDEFVAPNFQADPKFRITNYTNNMTVLDIMEANPHAHYQPGSACYPKNRFRITIKESEPEQVYKDVPSGINATSLMTLRYRYSLGGTQADLGKSFIDVSRMVRKDFGKDKHAVHRPVKTLCGPRTNLIPFEQSPFVVYHYAGTLEAYISRQDPRNKRNATTYNLWFGNTTGAYEDDTLRFWIASFVDQVGGIEYAQELLAGAGDVTLKA